MKNEKLHVIKKYLTPELFLVIFLLILSSYLRLKDLGYSDYIGDEHKAFIVLDEGETLWQFLISQRKGPMQFFVSYLPYLITNDFSNELAQRIPFTIFSIFSVLIFYLFVKKVTKNLLISGFSTFLFMINGFIVGFGRIAQYQNLNIFFSLLALYFYSDLLYKEKKLIRSTLLGTIFWCISILSHWDAVFILVPVVWFFILFLKNKKFTKEYKIRILIYNFILGCFLILPFMIPYVSFHKSNEASVSYFSRRIEPGYSNSKVYKIFIDLYNPFVTFYLLVALSVLSIFRFKKNYPVIIWFLFVYILFEIFVRKPGTHIYNFLIPIFILSGYGIDFIFKVSPKLFKYIFGFLFILISLFLYFQTHLIFVDHKIEYPWDQEKIIMTNMNCISFGDSFVNRFCGGSKYKKVNLKTKKYYYEYEGQKLPLFGFPHKRYWKEINEYINDQNIINGEDLGYSTNEDQTVSRWYMDVNYRSTGTFYYVGIKNPVNFVVDYSLPVSAEGEVIYTINSQDGLTLVKIHKASTEID